MKKLSLTLVLMAFMTIGNAQISKEDYGKLPKNLQEQVDSCLQSRDPVREKLDETSEYVQIGHQIGVAVNETLRAIEETTVRLSETKIGKTAIFIVVWKLLGTSFIRLGIGVLLYILSIISGSRTFKRWTKISDSGRRSTSTEDTEVFIRILSTAILFFGATVYICNI